MRREAAGMWKRSAAFLLAVGGVSAGCPGRKPAVDAKPVREDAAVVAPSVGEPWDIGAFGMADADVYVRVEAPRLLSSEAFRQIFNAAQQARLAPVGETAEKSIEEKIGVDLSRVERLDVSFTAGEPRRVVAAALFKGPYDKAALIERISRFAEGEQAVLDSHNGVDLCLPANREAFAFAFVAPTALAFGDVEAIKAAIDGLKSDKAVALPPKVKELMDGAPADAALVVVVPSPARLAELQGRLPVNVDLSGIESMSVAVTAGENLDMRVRVNAVDAAAAGRILSSLELSVEKAKAAASAMTASGMPPVDGGDGFDIGTSGEMIEVNATLTPDIIGAASPFVSMALMRAGHAVPGADDDDLDFDFGDDFDADFEDDFE
jgi:hypothetical protein